MCVASAYTLTEVSTRMQDIFPCDYRQLYEKQKKCYILDDVSLPKHMVLRVLKNVLSRL